MVSQTHNISFAKNKKFLLFLFVLSLLVRMLFFIFILEKGKHSWLIKDSKQYVEISQQIQNGYGITEKDDSPSFYRLPGYPCFLALCNKLFGTEIPTSLWVQIVLLSLIPLLIFFLTGALFPSNLLLAKTTSLFSCFHLGFVMYAGMILTEGLFLFFFLLFLLFLLSVLSFEKKLLSKKPFKNLLFAGFFLGIATMIRPVGHYIMIIALPLIFFSLSKNFLEKIKKISLFASTWLAVISPLLIRNFMLTGFIFFHTLAGAHFLTYMATPSYMEKHNCSFLTATKELRKEWHHEIKKKEKTINRKLNKIETCQIGEKIALRYALQRPLTTIKHAITQVLKTCFALHSKHLLLIDQGWPNYTNNTSFLYKLKRYLFPDVSKKILLPLIFFDIIFLFLLWIGFILFLVGSIYNATYENILKIIPFFCLFIGLTIAYGNARLRLPIEPLLIITSTAGWFTLLKKKLFSRCL